MPLTSSICDAHSFGDTSFEISTSPYVQIFDLFDVKGKGFLDFGDFVRALNLFHPNVPQEDKIDCKDIYFLLQTSLC